MYVCNFPCFSCSMFFLFTGKWSELSAVGEFIRGQVLEESTKVNIRSQLRAYLLSCKFFDLTLFPVGPLSFKAYIVFLCKSLKSYTTMFNYLNVLIHDNLHLRDDVSFMYDYDCLLVKKVVKKILGANQNRKHEISIQLLLLIVRCLDDSITLHCCMKFLLFLVVFFSILRRSNLLANSRDESGRASLGLLPKDVSIAHGGALLWVYITKTLLFEDSVLSIPIPAIPKSILCPVAALKKYMSLVPAQPDDPLFMVPANGNFQPISGKTANDFLKSV